ncbi:CpaF family protein [Streptantibioticus ferralitis]|uniref:CpaF family protein n=1 Tax=Streptantibioticus ferralitis TaxID=236510 RepID=UPI0023D9FE6E|nr:CpaF/VirB11 family protein [Streptantibioticus ferralitis]
MSATDVSGLPGALPVPWAVIQDLRRQVSDDVTEEQERRAQLGQRLVGQAEEAFSRSAIARRVAAWAAQYAQAHEPLTRGQETTVQTAVFDAMHRAGPVQRYLDDPSVENIAIDGWDLVFVQYNNKSRQRVPGFFSTDQELIDWVNLMAAQSGYGERALSPATPEVEFRLPDGSRATATLLTTRPTVAIRRHGLMRHGLEQLVKWGTIDSVLSTFLQCCVLAQKNILIAGPMDAGKTTLLRALARCVPAEERIATLESDRELFLDDRQAFGIEPHVLAFEARKSNGERDRSGNLIGEVSVGDMVPMTLRFNATRVIVGEVRSIEAFAMLDAMASGGLGGMCTIHARQPSVVLPRLVQLCTRTGMTVESAHMLVSQTIDLVVYIKRVDRTRLGGRVQRFVTEVNQVDGLTENGRPALVPLFGPRADDPRAYPQHSPSPEFIEDLSNVGFDPRWLQIGGQWGELEQEKAQ